MSEIGPVNDNYIDSIIKANAVSNPNVTRTLGVGLRQLVKLLRDRSEQEITNSATQLGLEAAARAAGDNSIQNQINSIVPLTSGNIANTLGYVPANDALVIHSSVIGASNGVVPLDANAKISAAYLPSYVDDVLEFANLASLPATGESSKIYVTLDNNFEYRWSGSVYIRLVASPGTTDALTEGVANLYYTNARVATFGDSRYLGIGATAANSELWNGYSFDDLAYDSGFDLIVGRTTNSQQTRLVTLEGMRLFLGLGSNAYTSTSYYSASNPNGYITGYTETDPTVPAYSKTLSSFSVIRASTDALYPGLTGSGASGTWGININGQAGSISGQANSATIGASPSVIANAIVQRDDHGYINTNYINMVADIDSTTLGYFAGRDSSDNYIRYYSIGAVQAALGLGSGAYNDKTRLWSSSHPNDYYISNAWDGTYWQVTSNHGSPVSVGHAASANGATYAEYLANDTAYMRMHWSGQGGQPAWLWGGNDPNSMYVYNPSNFSVAYASNSGTLNGHPDSYFYPASNPNGYITSASGAFQPVENQRLSTGNSPSFSGLTCNTIITGMTNLDGVDLTYLIDPNNTGKVLIGWNKSASLGETSFISNRGAGWVGGFGFYDISSEHGTKQLFSINGTSLISTFYGAVVAFGDLYANNYYTNSDINLKENIIPIKNVSLALRDITAVEYDRKDIALHQTGFIAQNVQSHFPDLVKADESGNLTLNYMGMTVPLLKGWQEHDERINRLEQENLALKELIAKHNL
jgi:hypothetical protein